MWRSHLTRNLGKKLLSLQNPSPCSSQSQVFNHNCCNSLSYSTNLFIRVIPRNYTHQNLRFLSHSSSISSKDSNFSQDIDKNGEINDAHGNNLWSIDEFTGEKSGLADDIFGNGGVGTNDLKLKKGVSSETIDVEKLESVRSFLQSTVDKSIETCLDDLVKEVGNENGGVSVELLNQLISVFSKLGKGKAAFEVFRKFDDLGCVPNVDTYYLTISALWKRSFYDWAASVSQKMIEAGMIPDSEKVGDIISLYCKCQRSKDAHDVYLAAKEKSIYPPKQAINFLISCLSNVDETVPLAKEMLGDFSVDSRKHALGPFTWVVCGLCRTKDIHGGKRLLLEMIEKGPAPGNSAFDSLINALSKAGELEDAKEMLQLMESRGLKPDASSYNFITSGHKKFMEEACKVLADAKKKVPEKYPPTLQKLIDEYCQLEHVNEAVKLLGDMGKFGVELDEDENNKWIRHLCLKAIDCETAKKILEEMETEEMHLPWLSRFLRNKLKEQEHKSVDICGLKYETPAAWIDLKPNGVETSI